MLSKYLKLFKNKIFYLILIIGLVIVSSVTKGKTAKTFAVIAGIAMIFAAITFILWIIKTPVKNNRDEAV